MMQINRREFAALLAAASLRGANRRPEVAFPAEPRERLAVATYPFRNVISAAKPLAQFAATIPGTFGVHGIEPWSHHVESLEPDYLAHLHDAFSKAGVRVVNIPVDIRANLCGTAAERSEALTAYRRWVDAAIVLHAPSIRVHLPGGSDAAGIQCAVSGLKELAEYGASKNIVINIENDDPSSEKPERIVRVLKAVKSPYLHALPDFGNSMAIHNDQTYNRQALSLLFPFAYNISHVKDMLQDEKTVYRVDMEQLFTIAKDSGYKGYFSMEWDSEGDPFAGTKHLIQSSLRNLA
jgi:sugar phosphate isomerase/epimerase